ncbi:MAG: hypothetical protein VB092_00385 [Oscillospiraceae bacterium]|nr:hypothetical protein [Oscillospiraceae bacterium]
MNADDRPNALPSNAAAPDALSRLCALVGALQAELRAGETRMTSLRAAGREKSAEYRQLFAGRLQLLFMLRRLGEYGLLDENTKNEQEQHGE